MNRSSPGEGDEEVLDLRGVGDGVTRRSRVDPVCLIGKVCSDKAVNSYALTEVMIKAFCAKDKLSVRD
ncbi:hypothetical protein ACS0TY_001067 [Phlomoides rotata]